MANFFKKLLCSKCDIWSLQNHHSGKQQNLSYLSHKEKRFSLVLLRIPFYARWTQTRNFHRSFGFVSTLRKKVFLGAPVKCVFFMAQITEILLFLWMQLLQRSKITIWEQHLFLEKVYGSFGFVFTLHKKVFSGAPVKYFSLYGPNNSDSVVFRNAPFGEIKDHSLRTTPFQKKRIAMEVLGLGLPYVKSYFHKH